jgi:N-acyl-D-aspartate/D-glutamate deacylase
MDALDRRPKALNIATQIPHAALRAYVMGERGIHHDETTPDDLFEMCNIVREALKAGAYGLSTSRTFLHKYDQRKYPPGTFATGEEISTLGLVLGEVGHGVFQMTANHISMHHEIPWMRNLALKNKLPVIFNLQQTDPAPDLWKDILGTLKQAHQQSIPLFGAVCGRPVGLLFSWQSSLHPFILSPAYLEIAQLPWVERIAKLRQPEVRQAILSGDRLRADLRLRTMFDSFHKLYRLADDPDYEPEQSQCVQAMMQAQGRTGLEIVYDLMMERDGKAILYYPSFNYTYGNLDHLYEWLSTDVTVNSLSDGGAHCNYICDVSMPTFMLTHWSRSRNRGAKFNVEAMVKRQTQDTARIYGMHERGTLALGKKADINIIDFEKLRLFAPEMVQDLPAGGQRLTQRCEGYIATLVEGQPIFENQRATGALPGKLLRAGRKN